MLKIFRGVEPTTKIFYTKFFHNEIISFENFPDYGIPNTFSVDQYKSQFDLTSVQAKM